MRRTLLWIAFAFTVPFALLGVVLILGSLFGIAFITSFHVENQTEQTLRVTPIGRGHSGERPMVIPQVMAPFVPLPPLRSSDIRIAPGRSIRISWDMDDHYFTHLLVRSEDGRLHQWEVNPDPEARQRLPQTYAITSLDQLEPASAEIQAAAARDRHHRVWFLWLAGIGGMILAHQLWRRLTRIKETVPKPAPT